MEGFAVGAVACVVDCMLVGGLGFGVRVDKDVKGVLVVVCVSVVVYSFYLQLELDPLAS